MAPPLTIGCFLYGWAGTGFGLCILGMMASLGYMNLMRGRRLADIGRLARLNEPKSPDDQRREGYAWKLFLAALVLFAVGVSTELWGLQLGLFGSETACPSGWSQPRSLRALTS